MSRYNPFLWNRILVGLGIWSAEGAPPQAENIIQFIFALAGTLAVIATVLTMIASHKTCKDDTAIRAALAVRKVGQSDRLPRNWRLALACATVLSMAGAGYFWDAGSCAILIFFIFGHALWLDQQQIRLDILDAETMPR